MRSNNKMGDSRYSRSPALLLLTVKTHTLSLSVCSNLSSEKKLSPPAA